jgi:hypothetical protein
VRNANNDARAAPTVLAWKAQFFHAAAMVSESVSIWKGARGR